MRPLAQHRPSGRGTVAGSPALGARPSAQMQAAELAPSELHDAPVDTGRIDVQLLGSEQLVVDAHAPLRDQSDRKSVV